MKKWLVGLFFVAHCALKLRTCDFFRDQMLRLALALLLASLDPAASWAGSGWVTTARPSSPHTHTSASSSVRLARHRSTSGSICERSSAWRTSAGRTSAERSQGGARRVGVRMCEGEVNPGSVEGTELRVLEYPHPTLRAPNEEVTEFNAELRQLTREMFLLMYASRGVGLAAPQVGVLQRVIVIDVCWGREGKEPTPLFMASQRGY